MRGVAQDFSESVKCSHPQHLDRWTRSFHSDRDVLEGQSLDIPQEDDFAVVLGQLGNRFGHGEFLLLPEDNLTGRVVWAGRFEGGRLRIGLRIAPNRLQGKLPLDLPFVGREMAVGITGIVSQYFSQPGEPLLFGAAGELSKVAMGVQECLLDEIRSIHFRLQASFQSRPGHQIDITATSGEQPVARNEVPLAGLSETFIEVGHVSCQFEPTGSGSERGIVKSSEFKTSGGSIGNLAHSSVVCGLPVPCHLIQTPIMARNCDIRKNLLSARVIFRIRIRLNC